MGRPRETFNKKEREKKKQQKKKEKEQRKEERKANAKDSQTFDDMIAYVDENGNISATPPDPSKKKEISAASIELGVPPAGNDSKPGEGLGNVKFFDQKKGYGFIEDIRTGDNIFVHMSDLNQVIRENDKVTFKTKKSFKGLTAFDVKLVK